MLLFLLALVALNDAAQYYSVTSYWREDSCTLGDTLFATDAVLIRSGLVACESTEHGCECIPGTSTCTKTQCIEDDAVNVLYPPKAIQFSIYNATGQNACFGNFIGYGSVDDGSCFAYKPPVPGSELVGLAAVCGTPYFYQFSSLTCATPDGEPVGTRIGSDSQCYTFYGGMTIRMTCINECFHEDTTISYGDEIFTLKTLQNHPSSSCVVPHVVTSDGVKIITQCQSPLRLTNKHLVYTQRGLITASSVTAGDFLYTTLDEKVSCEVITVIPEFNQKYFGLNCEESTVLANGYKTSTFGITHDIPAFWMKYASKLFGIQTASTIGDYIASFLHAVRLI